MEITKIKDLLRDVKEGKLEVEQAFQELKNLPYENLEYVKIDHHRAMRMGVPEVIYCEGKKIEYILEIFQKLSLGHKNILATGASKEAYEAVKSIVPEALFYEDARIIVVAGMEGALASVVGGLVDKPVVAVPTSIGYGASFGGLAALLTMLNSCASGVGVVNIDNGFGAGYLASQINKLGM